MQQERVEEYLGAIYRLRVDSETPLPLSQLTEYFGFSSVSVHEMVQKLDSRGWVIYHPYRGVTLTASGEEAAGHLLRWHRLWERFLTDILEIPWDEAHVVAGRLEHAATPMVMERLSTFLGDPRSCPHGAPIPPGTRSDAEQRLSFLPAATLARIVRISPETPALLRRLESGNLLPGRHIEISNRSDEGVEVRVEEVDRVVTLSNEDAAALWVEAV
jgi:DtxR family Mn-dependent transcriptional regulator